MDEYGQACFVEYQYGVDQALAVNNLRTVNNSRIHDLPSVAALVDSTMHVSDFQLKKLGLRLSKQVTLTPWRV